jgi:hypothetical protein
MLCEPFTCHVFFFFYNDLNLLLVIESFDLERFGFFWRSVQQRPLSHKMSSSISRSLWFNFSRLHLRAPPTRSWKETLIKKPIFFLPRKINETLSAGSRYFVRRRCLGCTSTDAIDGTRVDSNPSRISPRISFSSKFDANICENF